MKNSNSLSGKWTGIYDYPEEAHDLDPVPFEVNLTDTDGQLYGLITERNTIFENAGEYLTALLSGKTNGDIVKFLKIYEASDESGDCEIAYEGTLNADRTAISGSWTTIEDCPWSGRFVMNRPKTAEIEQSEKETNKISII